MSAKQFGFQVTYYKLKKRIPAYFRVLLCALWSIRHSCNLTISLQKAIANILLFEVVYVYSYMPRCSTYDKECKYNKIAY